MAALGHGTSAIQAWTQLTPLSQALFFAHVRHLVPSYCSYYPKCEIIPLSGGEWDRIFTDKYPGPFNDTEGNNTLAYTKPVNQWSKKYNLFFIYVLSPLEQTIV